jgi:glycosidase
MCANKKIIVYQVFTRLFGNTKTLNKPWGTIAENGVGKFADFTNKALSSIKELGVTHIWYTGVLHHALVGEYAHQGISYDHPEIVKGRAGSPYAIKDYYNVNPDLAVDVKHRLEEFEELITRSHQHGLKVVIDIVPNHVARKYQSISKPKGVKDFGEDDDVSKQYEVNNNFYYNPAEFFSTPRWEEGYQPLGGEPYPYQVGDYIENPARWTGNGSRNSQPGYYDWYETAKLNFGVAPDGNKDFDELPDDYQFKNHQTHVEFWQNRNIPDTWLKFRDIVYYWLDKGVDGFRYDMAELVPVEFWSFLNSAIKVKKPTSFLLAEVYEPNLYRPYLGLGKMDYLYDKVSLYDNLKDLIKGQGCADYLIGIQDYKSDIEHQMLHFLENHDEHRVASADFAANAQKAFPAMVVSAMVSTSPIMLYFGQEVGEPALERAGFGSPGRTSIFDYIGVPHHQRWMNHGKFDGGQSTVTEKNTRDFYQRLLKFTANSSAVMGNYQEIHNHNKAHCPNYNDRLFSFVRWCEDEKLIVIVNFQATDAYDLELKLPSDLLCEWGLEDQVYKIEDQLYKQKYHLTVKQGIGCVSIKIAALESLILRVFI